MKKFLLLSFLIISITLPSLAQVKAQDNTKNKFSQWYIEPAVRFGTYIPFEKRHNYLAEKHQYNFDLHVGYQTTGKKEWEQRFNFPSYGFFFRYEHNTIDSAKYEHRDANGLPVTEYVNTIGDCYSAGGFINGNFYRGRSWSFDYDILVGLSLWPKYGNEFIGSLVNVHLGLDVGPTFRISRNMDLGLRFWFAHSSNGAIVLPNNGVNVYGYQLNCRYNINGREDFTYSEWEPFKKKTYIFLSEAPGFLQTTTRRNGEIAGEPGYYFGNTFRIGVSRHFHPMFRYDVGLDFCYSGETKVKYLQAKDNYEAGILNVPLCEYRPINSMHLAASAMFEVLYNKVAFCFGLSYYLYHGIYKGTDEKKSWGLSGTTPFESQYLPSAYTNYYERLGLKYYFGTKNNQFVGAFMKVHIGSIDYIEWTYGINLDVFR